MEVVVQIFLIRFIFTGCKLPIIKHKPSNLAYRCFIFFSILKSGLKFIYGFFVVEPLYKKALNQIVITLFLFKTHLFQFLTGVYRFKTGLLQFLIKVFQFKIDLFQIETSLYQIETGLFGLKTEQKQIEKGQYQFLFPLSFFLFPLSFFLILFAILFDFGLKRSIYALI